ncbi:rhomboid family protein [Babesia ovata]|uniref:Rhomboid family protein n=1 Tax=Babesia ovata TaxID=189622 RepID=A0A2H6KIE6_9APIC|nr:rhomboid family protein [Babesia ovata]GBE62756.1 rhomboid family protein [Babesia ovata]
MFVLFLAGLLLLRSPLTESHRATYSGDIAGTYGGYGRTLAFVKAPRHLTVFRLDDGRGLSHTDLGFKAANNALRVHNAHLGAAKCDLRELKRDTTRDWGKVTTSRDHPPQPQWKNNGQTVSLAAISTTVPSVYDWINNQKDALRSLKETVKQRLTNPGTYLARVCRESMSSAERGCRIVSKELHTWYLKACNLGFKGIIAFSHDPIANITRAISFAYALGWWVGPNSLRTRCDMNPIEVFSKGQYYRFFTSLFLHNGVIHMLQNIKSLWAVGAEALTLLGPRRLMAVYLASGTIANYISYIYNFAYKNGLPADLVKMTQAVVQRVGQSGRSTSSIVEKVVDRIRNRYDGASFPVFMLSYANTTLFHLVDGAVGALLPFVKKARQETNDPEVEAAVNAYIRRKIEKRRACGASAAIYGLMGAICACHLRFGGSAERRRMVEVATSALIQNLVPFAGGNIDHVAHLAGFLAGMGIALSM